MNSKKKISLSDYLKKKNVKRFSLFFAIAFIFLIFSKLSNDYKQTIELKVNLRNTEDEIVIQNDSANFLSAYIEAKGFTLLPYLFNKSTEIVLDAKTNVTSKPNLYIFDVQKHKYLIEEQLGKSYKVLSLLPDTLNIAYSKRASKLVPVTFTGTINYAIGYDVKGNFGFNVDSVKIVGAASEVDKINTLTTNELILKDVKNNISENIDIDISEYQNIEVFPKSVDVRAEVTRFTEGTIEVPITITNKPSDVVINYFPKSVTLSYYVDLENYKSIKASDFIIECNYGDIKNDQSYFVPKVVEKPKFIKRVSIKQKRIDFIKL